ncbi:MAG TPA: hypothetical protein QF694_02565 [Dehalococcoidia bacterium]|nr:hypothetical protein [Chloroflexota bacterium]MDP6055914.1 hypothetical protein [Dehalococcoidia bacterium]MDP7261420.1 hypothetical protein [Dehalococcoidia bacterium]MDP7485828.1 hypothetical protein [Dehalococcoidia bacterium]HJP27674.1 hypothetical protein [Dehalococcoidia bacterium]
MTQGPDNGHDHAADTHRPGPPSESEDTQFNWRIHHPFEGVEDRVAVEVGPWKGLLPRWRFVLPADFDSPQRWGVGPAGTGEINEDVRLPAKDGPIQMVNGPLVVWFGGHESLTTKQSAYLVLEGQPPHYIAFGQADNVGGPPDNLEGISFGDDHPTHPDAYIDQSHGHAQVAPPPHPPGFDPHTGHDHSPGHWEHDLSAHDHSDHQH